MEVMKDHSATKESKPAKLGTLTAAARFAVLAAVLTVNGHEPRRIENTAVAIADAEPTTEEPWLRQEDLADGTSLIGKRLDVAGTNVEIRRRNGEIELMVNHDVYRIKDTLNVNIGASIVSATYADGIVTIVTTEHGTAKVRWEEIERIVRELDGRRDVSSIVSTVFEPQGTALCGAIGLRRMFKGHVPGEEETYDVAFERMENPPDERLSAITPERSAPNPTSAR